MKKCKYCGKKLKDNFEFCNSKCENCYEKLWIIGKPKEERSDFYIF